jgi:hypothetical protein
MKKMRKFANGGVSEGQNPNIDDDTRSRAMKFVEDASEESRDIGEPVTVTKTKTSVTAAKSKPKADDSSEKERMEKMVKEQALERVEPENYIPGPGLLKGLLKSALRTGEKEVARTVTTKAGKEIPVKQGKPDFSGSAKEGMGMKSIKNKSGKEISVTRMKSGGSVSSASRRADGCAIRGKTRA